MNINIITLFPDMFKGPFDMSMIWKAQDKKLATIIIHDLREYGIGARRTVDDVPYGGGDGMVLKPEPVVAAIEKIKGDRDAKVIVMTPSGTQYTQAVAQRLSEEKDLIIIAGHYEGFDERIMDYVDEQISIGDYVLTGGELPAMVLVDSIVRLVPGVLGGELSAHEESFSDPNLVEHPHYTRPAEFRGKAVPDVLLSGHHAEIEKWRAEQSAAKTKLHRPDLGDSAQ